MNDSAPESPVAPPLYLGVVVGYHPGVAAVCPLGVAADCHSVVAADCRLLVAAWSRPKEALVGNWPARTTADHSPPLVPPLAGPGEAEAATLRQGHLGGLHEAACLSDGFAGVVAATMRKPFSYGFAIPVGFRLAAYNMYLAIKGCFISLQLPWQLGWRGDQRFAPVMDEGE